MFYYYQWINDLIDTNLDMNEGTEGLTGTSNDDWWHVSHDDE